MRLRRTLPRSRRGHPALAWAFRYALAAVVVGTGMLLIGPSPGVGWALIVFGGCLAILTSGPPPGVEVRQTPVRRDRPLELRVGAGPTAESDTPAVNAAPAQPAGVRAVRARSRDSDMLLGAAVLRGQAPSCRDRLRSRRRPPAAPRRGAVRAPGRRCGASARQSRAAGIQAPSRCGRAPRRYRSGC